MGLGYSKFGCHLHTIENVLINHNHRCRGDLEIVGVLPPEDLDSGDYVVLADSRTAAEVWPEKTHQKMLGHRFSMP